MGRIEEAKQRYEGALKIYETLLSTDPENVGYQSDVGTTRNNLRNLLSDMEKYDDALKLYERALDVIETGMGASNPYFGKIMENIIWLYEKMARE
jgi:tetratricopeptide (TPR) repeat protein